MSLHFEPIALGTFAFAQVVANAPQMDFTNIGFGTIVGFLVYWITKDLSQKLDKLGDKIDRLGEKIDKG